MTENCALGSLTIPEQELEYAITYIASRGVHIVQDLNPKTKFVLDDAPPLIPSSIEATHPVPPSGSFLSVTGQVNVDLIIVYTPNAMNWAANPVAVTMRADKTISANFLRIIYPASNARGEKVLNRSLSQAEI